jgi:hypothetical protein
MLACTGGCIGIGFGEVTYSAGHLGVTVDNPSDPLEATLQVTVFRTEDFKQTEVANFAEMVTFQSGQNAFTFPVDLEPGTYKLYLYITKGSTRTVSVIRDIRV